MPAEFRPFFESGVVSLNLPTTAAVIGGHASRTTHPLALQGFERLFRLIFETPFEVTNPFHLRTKADILKDIKTSGYGGICADTVSCVHTIDIQKGKPHCGQCSQCIDRRFAALAAGLDDCEDPKAGYRTDVLVGQRSDPVALALMERYAGTAVRINEMATIEDFMEDYAGEVSRVLRCNSVATEQTAEHIFRLYKTHARQVCDVLSQAIRDRADDLLHKRLPNSCMVSIAAGVADVGPRQQTLSMSVTGDSDVPCVDRDKFTVRFQGAYCELGNSKEFQLFELLAQRLGVFVSLDTLRSEIWQHSDCQRNTIARAASNLRRVLRKAGVQGLEIKGIKDNYKMSLAPEGEQKV